MEDDKSTTPVEEESTDTSVDETTQAINDINFDDDAEDTTEKKSEDKSEESTEEEKEEESTDESEDTTEEETEDKTDDTQSDEEKRKAHNREMAEKRIQEKEQRERSLQESQEKYLDEAENDDQLALRQIQVDNYNNRVERNTDKLTTQYERAVKDFDILSDSSPEIQAEVNAALDAFQAMHLTIDEYGNPKEVKADLYQYLQSKADSISKLTSIGARKQTQNKDREKSKTFTTPSRSPKQKEDPLMDALLAD